MHPHLWHKSVATWLSARRSQIPKSLDRCSYAATGERRACTCTLEFIDQNFVLRLLEFGAAVSLRPGGYSPAFSTMRSSQSRAFSYVHFGTTKWHRPRSFRTSGQLAPIHSRVSALNAFRSIVQPPFACPIILRLTSGACPSMPARKRTNDGFSRSRAPRLTIHRIPRTRFSGW